MAGKGAKTRKKLGELMGNQQVGLATIADAFPQRSDVRRFALFSNHVRELVKIRLESYAWDVNDWEYDHHRNVFSFSYRGVVDFDRDRWRVAVSDHLTSVLHITHNYLEFSLAGIMTCEANAEVVAAYLRDELDRVAAYAEKLRSVVEVMRQAGKVHLNAPKLETIS